jgi:quinol monooxygenase YgiN
MPLYQIKIAVKKYKIDEFVDSLHALVAGVRTETGCLDYSVYQNLDEKHAFCIVAVWETHEAMQQHFKTQEFEVLVGAARVLGETFEMIIAKILKTRSFNLASNKRSLRPSRLCGE